ncbi:hypothetical protein WA026_008366 [Henosepilachna vigintioctopunctata]|uniref:non-specific serine/threonine protein kinase n=1 Tax=Henosepilachna vigintioctopunctata TaxID=420089 RepID=A0AAW1UH67_9CUCU
MDKYEVLGSLGEGSFGRVYKAKQISNSQVVALKVISKRGRTTNEIKDLRGECEIQRYLHHPNIIQMLDSFETDNEIVVITEFAHKELNTILGELGYLSEDHVQCIVWDLVSALYYLHSHRVLHRDLKPQNILLDTKNRAKLCDFGFARNMSSGTHVLTSIKGTPLYMAPELIDELPYDHNADLWSLGCIIYELLVGAPPFCTASILHLIRRIKNEQVQWPTFLSHNCISFLKGLLQKDPKKRLTWTEILVHPWVKGNILILEKNLEMPLTKNLSSNTLNLKDLQSRVHVNLKNSDKISIEGQQKNINNSKGSEKSSSTSLTIPHSFTTGKLDTENNNIELNDQMNELTLDTKGEVKKQSVTISNESEETVRKCCKVYSSTMTFVEENHPIETEEWSVFLLKSIEEVMSGEMISLTQPNLTNILVSPLKNSTTSPKVLIYIAKLFSIPFVVKGTSKETIETIRKVYLEVQLVPNLIYSSKLLVRQSMECSIDSVEKYKNNLDLNDEDLDALEHIYLLISHLVHVAVEFLIQLCDGFTVLNMFNLLHRFLCLLKRRPRVVLDLLAICILILRNAPENSKLVHEILTNDVGNEENPLSLVNLLRHEYSLMRERTCYLILFLEERSDKTLRTLWDDDVKETLEALMFDSIETVRNAAERCVELLKKSEFLN